MTIDDCKNEGKGIAFDADVLINMKQGRYPEGLLLQIPISHRFTTVINAFEFLRGEGDGEDWMRDKRIRIIPISKQASETFWSLFKAGESEEGGLADWLTAATVIANRFALATANVRHFENIRKLPYVQEFAP